ncbi:MAG TPA: TIGR02266 family protein [Pseudomonadota bacterium]|nr:TIGR02266 family protein [Pseudomonadota bacterium]HNK46474.1 TIGR02266 family protein [Pseudomonadota bacterium]HNN51413.1 TIGR02266 family protein [Pseudomonadota bacterium]
MNSASESAQPDVIAIRFRLQYPDVDTFVAKYAVNISEGGIFIASMDPPAVGSIVRFELSIAGGQPILRGEGQVVWNAPFDPLRPMDTCGMSLRFLRMDADGVALIRRVLSYKSDHPERFFTAAPDPYATAAYRPQPPAQSHPQVAQTPQPSVSQDPSSKQTPVHDSLAASQLSMSARTPVPGEAPRPASHPSMITPAALEEELADLLKPKAASTVTPADASKKLSELLDRRLRPPRT